MARVLVLTDRSPHDTDWKGALIWRTILALAESQHEVLVATPVPFTEISVSHPRLNIVRPVESWRLDQLPKLAKTLLTYRPDIVHTFALKPSRLWPSLSLWPYLAVLPGLRKITTLFDQEDVAEKHPAFVWYQSSSRLTAFSESLRHSLGKTLARAVDLVPLEWDLKENESSSSGDAATTVIPAAVSEWRNPQQDLAHLTEYLRNHPNTQVRIIGGWGAIKQSERKEYWRGLGRQGMRLNLCESLPFSAYIDELKAAESVWLEPLMRDSWKFLLSYQLAGQLGKELILSTPAQSALASGSTANSLSRLYAGLNT